MGKKVAAKRAAGHATVQRAPIRQVNPERKKRLDARNFGGPDGKYGEHIRSLPCCACGSIGFTQAAHVVARGMGGGKGSWKDLVPLCADRLGELGCHSLWDLFRDRFRQRFPGLDPAAMAAELSAEYLRRKGLVVE